MLSSTNASQIDLTNTKEEKDSVQAMSEGGEDFEVWWSQAYPNAKLVDSKSCDEADFKKPDSGEFDVDRLLLVTQLHRRREVYRHLYKEIGCDINLIEGMICLCTGKKDEPNPFADVRSRRFIRKTGNKNLIPLKDKIERWIADGEAIKREVSIEMDWRALIDSESDNVIKALSLLSGVIDNAKATTALLNDCLDQKSTWSPAIREKLQSLLLTSRTRPIKMDIILLCLLLKMCFEKHKVDGMNYYIYRVLETVYYYWEIVETSDLQKSLRDFYIQQAKFKSPLWLPANHLLTRKVEKHISMIPTKFRKSLQKKSISTSV